MWMRVQLVRFGPVHARTAPCERPRAPKDYVARVAEGEDLTATVQPSLM